MPAAIDDLDRRLLQCLAEHPRAGVMELARQLEVARGTVQARMEKLQQRGVVTGYGPDIDLRSIGYDVIAFVTLEISQGALETVVSHLATLPEVLEVHTTTGPGDLLCRVVAPTNADLQPLIGRMLSTGGIERTTTQIALTEQIPYRVLPLVADPGDGDA
ncbi:Lrp/AsnC family transcriptional regulator [Acidimicrobiia bacterium EGI L10123]|uniref:Lrp/AsnC family transcriptional regulator n=1 Tax=Salinilacustrithrix flava TaxID=2957203 RepID=UPI003D7C2ED5|nr:Lrp/AsnC family transcriptional regulator [Acidimicrobiia bacterium EGI L10123]